MSSERRTTDPGFTDGPLRNTPPEIIEALGIETVEEVAQTSDVLANCQRIVRLPDPFERLLVDRQESLMTTEVQDALAEIAKADDLFHEEPGSDDIRPSVRASSPILSQVAVPATVYLRSQENTLREKLNGVESKIKEVESVVDEQKIKHFDELELFYEILPDIASEFPDPVHIEELAQILDAENCALWLDAVNTGARKEPAVRDELVALRKRTSRLPKTGISARRFDDAKKFNDIHERLCEAGSTSWRVKQSHREEENIDSDNDFIDLAPKSFEGLKDRGSVMVAMIKDIVRQASYGPADQLYCTLRDLWEEKISGEPDSDQVRVVEAYLAKQAKELETVARAIGLKTFPETRRTLRIIGATPINDAYRRALRIRRAEAVDPYRSVVPDQLFWTASRDAKDALSGGSHLRHPDAPKLANGLHDICFDRGKNVRLEQSESGLVVAAVIGKLPTVIEAVARIKLAKSNDDDQVQKLRRERPEQYAIIIGFDLKMAIYKIKRILGTPRYRNHLINCLTPAQVAQVESEIDKLVVRFEEARAETEEN